MPDFRVGDPHRGRSARGAGPRAHDAPKRSGSSRQGPDPTAAAQRARSTGEPSASDTTNDGPHATRPAHPFRDTLREVIHRGSTAVALLGVLVMVVTLFGAGAFATAYGPYEPVAPSQELDVFLSGGSLTMFPVEVSHWQGRPPASEFHYTSGGHVVVPDMADGKPRYGMRIQVDVLDQGVEPLVMWATPGEGGKRLSPSAVEGFRYTYPVQALDEQGDYRALFSTNKETGRSQVTFQLAGAAVLGAFDSAFAERGFAFVVGTAMLVLGLASALLRFLAPARTDAGAGDRRAPGRVAPGPAIAARRAPLVPLPAIVPATPTGRSGVPGPFVSGSIVERGEAGRRLQPTPGRSGFGRMEKDVVGIERWHEEGSGTPESLSEGTTRGWVIRLD